LGEKEDADDDPGASWLVLVAARHAVSLPPASAPAVLCQNTGPRAFSPLAVALREAVVALS
jgi:hypothetical protein